MKERNIILTTMSTINSVSKNFYYGKDNNLYCEGISQLEAGTKYYLGTQNIDEIIVIGSDKVIDEKDEKDCRLVAGKFKGRNLVKEQIENEKSKKPSAFAMYTYGIKCFINGEKEPSPVDYGENAIDPSRKKEIEDLIQSFDQELKINDKGVMSKLENRLKDNIKKEYLDETSQKMYKNNDYPDYAEYLKIAKSTDDFIRGVKEDKLLNQREKGRVFSKAIRFFQQKAVDEISELDKEAALKALQRYHEDIQKLIKELDDNKINRFGQEKEYLREYVYNQIPEKEKLHCRPKNKNVKIQFIPLKKIKKDKEDDGIDNFEKLLSRIARKDKYNEKVNIYLDVQGGARTDGHVRSAVLSLLNNDENKNVKLEQVIAIDYFRGNAVNPIIDETKHYKITDLVSGMNAFIDYGKANQLVKTWNELEKLEKPDSKNKFVKNRRIKNIIQLMQDVDYSLSLCDVDSLTENIEALYSELEKPIRVKDSNEEFIRVMRSDIKKDYEEIFDEKGKADILGLIKWANRKGFIQQAITLIESKMPGEMVKDGYFSYCRDVEHKEEACKDIIKSKLDLGDKNYKTDDMDYYLFQKLPVGKYKNDNQEKENKEKYWEKIRYKIYNDDETIAGIYAKIWELRNTTNHAGEEAMTYDKAKGLVTQFVQTYESRKKSIEENGDRLEAITLTREEILNYKEPKEEKHESKKKEIVSNLCVVNKKYVKKNPAGNIPSSAKKQCTEYICDILNVLKTKDSMWEGKEAGKVDRIYFEHKTELKMKLDGKLKNQKQLNVAIPSDFYHELESDIKKMIRDTNHKIYVISESSSEYCIEKVIDKNSF